MSMMLSGKALRQNVAQWVPTGLQVGGGVLGGGRRRPCGPFQRMASCNTNEHRLTLCLHSPSLGLELLEVLAVVTGYLPSKNP